MNLLRIFADRGDWFLNLLMQHLVLSVTSILLAGVIGLTLGILLYRHQRLAPLVMGVTNVAYTIPSIAMFGLLIPFTGIGNKTAIIALTIYALLPMVRNTYSGLNSVDKSTVEAAVGMGSTQVQLMFRILLPMALPIIIAGVRNMVVMTISLAGIAAYIGAGGLGTAIYRGLATNNTELVVSGSIAIAMLAILVDGIFGLLEKKYRTRGSRTK